jgi:DNA-binding transcriptional ArsR family regulator
MKKNIQQNSTDSTLTPKQIEVIEALASGASVSEAATRTGVDRSTVYHWTKDDSEYEAELILARRECADTMRARLRELADDAVKTIREIFGGDGYSPRGPAQSGLVCTSRRSGDGRIDGRRGFVREVAGRLQCVECVGT